MARIALVLAAVLGLIIFASAQTANLPTCGATATTACPNCKATAGCGFCLTTNSATGVSTGKCGNLISSAGSENITAFCSRELGVFYGSDAACPTDVKSPSDAATVRTPTSTDVKSPSSTDVKSPVSEVRSPSSTDVKSPVSEVRSPSSTDVKSPVDVRSPSTSVEIRSPNAEVKSPSSVSTLTCAGGCGDCIKNPLCGACLVTVNDRATSICRPLAGAENITAACSAKAGQLVTSTSGTCPAPVTICVDKSCGGCLSDAKCGFCSGSYNGFAWGICQTADLINAACTREGGAVIAAGSCEVKNSTVASPTGDKVPVPSNDVTDKINKGNLTEAVLNDDLVAKAPLSNFIVVVTIITQAQSTADGKSHFQTFVDVSGDTVPTTADKAAICESLKSSLSTHLSVKADLINCALALKPTTAKRTTTSTYVADLTVNDSSSSVQGSAASLIASASLLVASVLALLF